VALVKSVEPVGTPEEIKATGQSTSEWGSCAPNPGITQNHAVMGCPHYANCIFGFRNTGPKNVGVFIKLVTGVMAEKKMSCAAFMSGLYTRYKHQERAGEIVQVVAEEGGEIDIVERVPEQPNGGPTGKNMRITANPKTIVIEKFPRPGEEGSKIGPALGIQQKMEARMKSKLRAERDAYRAGIRPEAQTAPQQESAAEEQPEKEKAKAKRS
jgi:hypothetical protein